MTPEELKAIQEKLGEELKSKFDKQDSSLKSLVEEKVNAAVEQLQKGMIKNEEFDKMVQDAIKEYGDKATKLEEAVRKQGDIINGMKDSITVQYKKGMTLEAILEPLMPQIAKMMKDGPTAGFINVDFKNHEGIHREGRKTVNSIGNSVQPMDAPPGSPYAPGISTTPLSVYDIMRNPLFVSNYVNMDRTNLSTMAWINETGLTGLPTLVQEGASKPNSSRTFKVEFSRAKKIADYIGITEEFDKDLPYLSNQVQQLLQMDVARAFDLQIQADVIAAATQLNFTTQLGPNNLTLAPYKNQIFDATLWDGLFAMGTACRLANFVPNVSLINPITYGKLVMTKDTYGRYNTPPAELVRQVNPQQGNNVAADFALVGDLQQFNVFIYEDFSLKIGWINDDLIRNQFTVLSEVRFHDFISNARKQAIMYGDCKWIAEGLNGGSAFPVGS